MPRALHFAGMLERFFTDAAGTGALARALATVPEKLRPLGLKRLLARGPGDLPRERITAFERFGWEYVWRRSRARSGSEMTHVHLWAGRKFCRLVLKAGLGETGVVYTFNSAGLEVMECVRGSGVFTLMDQTSAPVRIEDHLAETEMALNPGWEDATSSGDARSEFAAREQAEWEQADLIICGSDFVRRGIQECGGPVECCAVVPYGVDPLTSGPDSKKRGDRLRVLICGSVRLQKGAPYALAAARALQGVAEFRWCGGVGVLPAAARRLSKYVELRGAVPRSQIVEHYAWADVFLLPSICEGSAGVCYEALAAGLPVITTPNAGSVVRDGMDGFIVRIRDAEAIAEKLESLARNGDLLEWMSSNARERAREFTVEKYGERLNAAIQGARATRDGSAGEQLLTCDGR